MKIGIYFTASKNDGGVYQYTLSVLEALAKIPGHSYFLIVTSPDLPSAWMYQPHFKVINLHLKAKAEADFTQRKLQLSNFLGRYFPSLMKYLYRWHLFGLVQLVIWFSQKHNIAVIDQMGLDAIIFPAAADLSYLIKTPAIVAIHDLQHRVHPEFPEVSVGGRWEYRENSYQQICRKAVKILVDSQVGKEDVMREYQVPANRIVILPFLAPTYLNAKITHAQTQKILVKHHIQQPYIYYPAKFWQHKNHLRLVAALHRLQQKGKKVGIVFTGAQEAEFGTYDQVMAHVQKFGLRAHSLGYVDEQTVSALYKGALALVMPTFFGPTNIPILEAWKMKTTVITSNIRGCREQVGEAAILVNPLSVKSLATAIEKLLTRSKLRQKLIYAGNQKLAQWQPADFRRIIHETLISIC